MKARYLRAKQLTLIDNILLIVTSSILDQCKIPNSNSFAIAETDTKAAPKPDCTAFLIDLVRMTKKALPQSILKIVIYYYLAQYK